MQQNKNMQSIKTPEGFINISTGRVHYIELGKGQPVNFLHANGFCAKMYYPFFKYLADTAKITACDIRGHGDTQSQALTKIKHWSIFADDLKEFLEQKATAPVTGIGHSLGGVITFMAAAKYPHLFNKIILIDPVIFPPAFLSMVRILKIFGLHKHIPVAKGARRRKSEFTSKEEAYIRFNGRGIFAEWPDEFVHSYVDSCVKETDGKAALKCDNEVEAQFFESLPTDIWKYPAKIKCPVLAVWGENSEMFFNPVAKKLKELIPDYQLRVISGANHFIPMVKPQELAQVIKEYL